MRTQIVHRPDIFYIFFKTINSLNKFFPALFPLEGFPVLSFYVRPSHGNFRCEFLNLRDGIFPEKSRLELKTSLSRLQRDHVEIKISGELRIAEQR